MCLGVNVCVCGAEGGRGGASVVRTSASCGRACSHACASVCTCEQRALGESSARLTFVTSFVTSYRDVMSFESTFSVLVFVCAAVFVSVVVVSGCDLALGGIKPWRRCTARLGGATSAIQLRLHHPSVDKRGHYPSPLRRDPRRRYKSPIHGASYQACTPRSGQAAARGLGH